MKMLYKFYGPPGTGKTHRLINRARAYVRVNTPLHKIGYFAFTRKAAIEAKTRMPVEDDNLEEQYPEQINNQRGDYSSLFGKLSERDLDD